MPYDRAQKAAWARAKRREAAIAAGRVPGRTGRPPTGRKAPKCHGDRVGQRRRRRERLIARAGDNGWTETRHPIMDQAAVIAQRYVRPDRRTVYHWPAYEEALSAAALAILKGADPDLAAQAAYRAEQRHAYHTVPFTNTMLEVLT